MILGIFFGIAAGALWALTFIIPLILNDVQSEFIALGRFWFYALFSVILLIFQKNPVSSLKKLPWIQLTCLSILGNSLYYVLMVESVRLSGVALTSLIVGSLPITITLFGVRTKAELKKFACPIALIVFGIMIVQWHILRSTNGHATYHESLKGTLLAIGAHISWLLFALWNASFLKKHLEIPPQFASNLIGIGSLTSMMIYLLLRGQCKGDLLIPLLISPRFLLGSAVLGLFTSLIANWFWNEASQRLPTTLAGQLIASETIFAICYEGLYRQKIPSASEMCAVVLLIIGISLSTWLSTRQRTQKS